MLGVQVLPVERLTPDLPERLGAVAELEARFHAIIDQCLDDPVWPGRLPHLPDLKEWRKYRSAWRRMYVTWAMIAATGVTFCLSFSGSGFAGPWEKYQTVDQISDEKLLAFGTPARIKGSRNISAKLWIHCHSTFTNIPASKGELRMFVQFSRQIGIADLSIRYRFGKK